MLMASRATRRPMPCMRCSSCARASSASDGVDCTLRSMKRGRLSSSSSVLKRVSSHATILGVRGHITTIPTRFTKVWKMASDIAS